MSGAWLEVAALARLFGALVLAGLAIKLVDAAVDGEGEAGSDGEGGAGPAGPVAAAAAYGVLCVAVASFLHPKLTAALVLGAHSLGMLHGLRDRTPLRLPAWVESAAALGAAWALAGGRFALFALAALLAVQAADDMVDEGEDAAQGRMSLVLRAGRTETGLIGFAAWMTAAALEPAAALGVALALPMDLLLARAVFRSGGTASEPPRGPGTSGVPVVSREESAPVTVNTR